MNIVIDSEKFYELNDDHRAGVVFFFEYMTEHTIEDAIDQNSSFCNSACNDCKLGKECYNLFMSGLPYLNKKQIDVVKEITPELFV